MIPRDHRESVVFTAVDMKFLCGVACIVVTLSELRLLLPNPQILKLATIAEKKNARYLYIIFRWERSKVIPSRIRGSGCIFYCVEISGRGAEVVEATSIVLNGDVLDYV